VRTFLRIIVFIWAIAVVARALFGPPSTSQNLSYNIGRMTGTIVAAGVVFLSVRRLFKPSAR
jgi:nitrate reductase gamma subunit